MFSLSAQHQLKPLSESITQSPRKVVDVSEDDVVLEGEVLHVAVNAGQLPILEDREPDVQHAVLVLRVLHDQEETEVARLPCAHHRLVHLLLALVENPPAV